VVSLNYQELIAALHAYWGQQGCAIMQPYHTELPAGTANPATFLRSLGPHPWRAAYVQPSIRPLDGRYGENPFRFQQHLQYQVILKPAPENVLDLYFGSLEEIGVDTTRHDIRLVEDDWEQLSIGAWGLGWEVWYDGMEITQFTYFQQVGGIELEVIPAEITMGLERLAMLLQEKQTAFDLEWAPGLTWGDVYREYERQWSVYNFEEAPVEVLARRFAEHEDEAAHLIERGLPLPAYDQVLKCSHLLNVLDARGAVSATERAAYLLRARNLTLKVARLYVEMLDADAAA
jgi:glycyl-tRNA synthetase alpha chain